MGGNVSSGQNNDELIDNLIESGLIKSNLVERVFRAVDRGIFYLPRFKTFAYRDLAWREGHIHISAPCIYTRVLESLELRENQSFLNIGSGTGYLSTMIGLILGSNGVNHNIELHADLIDYAREKLGEFVRTSVYFDDFDFCTPRFVQGNFLNLAVSNPDMIFYDRIYVGAGVSDEHEEFIKSLLKIDGILIMPLNDCLMKIRRINENLWEKNSIMTVSYASLITDSVDPSKKFSMPKLKPLTLQEICRFKIRQTIRQAIEKDHVEYYKVKREMSTFNKNRHTTSTTSSTSTKSTKSLRHRHHSNRHRRAFYGVEQFDDDDDDDDDDESDDNDEEEDDEDDDNIYDSDDQFGGDEESGNEQSRATAAATATSTTATTTTQATTTSPSESALARFERILRPRIGLNISYARFDRFDNQLRLLIGHGRVPNSNSNRPSPQQETTPQTPPTTSNPPQPLEQASGGSETATEAASSKKSISSRLAWLPMVSFRSQEDEPSSSSTSSIVSDLAVRNELSRTNSGIEETRMSQESRSSEMSDRSRGVRVSESGFSEGSSPLSRLSNDSVGSCNSNTSNSNPAAAVEAAEATEMMTNTGASAIANRKRHFSNGYNSETDPSDRDAEKFGSVSSGDEERTIKQLINSSSTTTASATNSDETTTAATEKIANNSNINNNTNNNLEESSAQNMSSSSEYPDHGGGEESSTSPDETANKIKSNQNDDLMKLVGSKTCGTVVVVGSGNGSGCGSQQRENLLRQRIMQLPLSPHVKSFLLYFRDI